MTRTTNSWTSFGATVAGPGHIAVSKFNQDAWSSFHHQWGDGISVSDGLGSKKLSNFGSDAACRAVERATHELSVASFRMRDFILTHSIIACWLDAMMPLDPREVSATCLFALRVGDGQLRLGMLGDGCVVAIRMDGKVIVLQDEKAETFSNMTTALGQMTKLEEWRLLDLDEDDVRAVVLCTDGVADDLEDIAGFVSSFVEEHCRLSRVTAARQVRRMLVNWPVPKHSDDKTIACLYRWDEFSA